jgi:hypothetical protein
MLQIQECIRIREQVSALLLMLQQGTTAATPATANPPDFNLNYSMMMQGHPASSNNMMFDAPSLAAASQATTVAPQRSTNTPSHEAKEKRWLIRYEELREFHTASIN